MQQIRQVVDSEFVAVNDFIIEQLHSNVPLVENIGHYIVDAGGKRLRPLLSLLSAGAIGQISEKHLQLAAVIEFIHTATLLHDDVVDISALRRGRPTANANWGNAPSVLVGDFLYSRAFQILVQIGSFPLMGLLSDTTNTVAEGEVLQLTRAGNPDTSEATYFEVIRSKTAVLFGAACSGAAILSDKPEQQDALHDYGINLGIAFQLIDDILDYEGDPAETGKNVGDDLAEGKPTLPLIYLLENGSDKHKQLVRDAISRKSAEQLEAIVDAVKHCGALDYCHAAAKRYTDAALAALNSLQPSPYRTALEELTEIALSRRS
ncbi:MAG: octaprenyl-diphosphate synthase [Zhongshania aliphaticivorans]|jgi:octaprenyl-diphosphate synthase|uniref:Octaprenyl diphosphate synthase n=1 Tax=Zhongshania aliphaticivorans TaxID=1470434 RepID=A0A127MAK0_9GAMM|nr:polyprenyl synthetase family protein [Zhongshania aliphaticivorans]AMO70250.1 octaprenyl diphosphate synthase [Zhongshania aliphaticivorans]|tara:strand:+ start:3920 stop:4879 length:960 start_codon:yes stop_codon:yes gene_type:complete